MENFDLIKLFLVEAIQDEKISESHAYTNLFLKLESLILNTEHN